MSRADKLREVRINPIVRQIVNRCHCGDSHLSVIRYLSTRVKGGTRAFLKVDRRERRDIMRQAIAVHDANRSLHDAVMSGNMSRYKPR